MDEPNEQDTKISYRKFGAGKGFDSLETVQGLNIFYVGVITIVLCILAIIVSITFATCFWILDKAL